MNKRAYSAPLRLLASLMIAALVCIGRTAMADEDPVSVEVNLVNTTVMQGEPIILNYNFTNTSNEAVVVWMPDQEKPWITIDAEDTEGHKVPAIQRPRRHAGEVLTSGCRVAAGASTQGRFVVSQAIVTPPPGHYRITVRVRAPYHHVGEVSKAQMDDNVAEDDTLSLTVTPPDLTRLRQMANTLGLRARDEKNVARNWEAIEALFSMPEQVALPTWCTLVSDPQQDNMIHIMEQLKRLGTSTAVDLLAEIGWNSQHPQEIRQVAKGTVRILYLDSKTALKSYIGQRLMRLDGKVPTTH